MTPRQICADELEKIADEYEDDLDGVLDLEDQLAIAFKIADLRRRVDKLRA